MPHPFETVAIIGLGLIGGSFARMLHQAQPQTTILAWDIQPDSLALARQEGVIRDALTGLDDPRLASADLIVLGTHLSETHRVLSLLSETLDNPAIIDLGSAKLPICRLADSITRPLRFIGGHPLAGREVSGYPNSRPNLFSGKRFLLTPCAKTDPAWQADLSAWLTSLGVHPVSLDAAEHDRLMSLVSHFPQFYAIALANLLHQNHPEVAMDFLGGGIDDQMRLMASSYEMWGDIYRENLDNMDALLSQFISLLSQMQVDLRAQALQPWFNTSHAIYARYRQSTQV